MDHCFSTKVSPPVIRINDFRTETEVSEHKGFANMLKGVFGSFRNTPAKSRGRRIDTDLGHTPLASWPLAIFWR